MRVCFVSALPPERSSMIGRALPLARAVARAGHVVELLTLAGATHPPFVSERMDAGLRIRTVGPALRATDVPEPDLATTLRRLATGRRALARALAETQADLLVLAKPQLPNTPPVLAHAERRGLPILLDVDDLEPEASRFPFPAKTYAGRLEARAVRAASLITACSPFLATHVQRLISTGREGKPPVEILPTGIAIPAARPPDSLRARLGLTPETPIVLYVGSLSLSSGHRVDQLLGALAAFPREPNPPHLVLAGTGLDERALRTEANRGGLGSRVHFLGRFTPPEDLAFAREATLLVDPVDRTPTNEAKSSHRVLLALATGTPVVAGNVGIRPRLLPTTLHADLLYDPAVPNALATALARGLRPDLRARFAAATRDQVTSYTWEVLGPRFVSLLVSLVRVPARASG